MNDYGERNVLYEPCSKGNLYLVQKIIQEHPEYIHSPFLPIGVAACEGHFDIVQFLVSKGASDNAKEDTLIIAAANGQLKIVEFLVLNGVNVHSQDNDAITLAAQNGYLEVVEYLAEHGANIHAQDEYALRVSSLEGRLNIVKFLVSKGADIHIWNDNPLVSAIHGNQIDVVRYLVHQGSMVNRILYAGCISVTLYIYMTSINPEFYTTTLLVENKINAFYTFVCSFYNKSTFERVNNIKENELFDPNLSLIVGSYCW